ncbi:MAG: hypothetical protein ACK417_08785 [Bacteroidia bacterium]
MNSKIPFLVLLTYLLYGCTKEPVNECANGNCFVFEGQLWDNLNNPGAAKTQLALVWNTYYSLFDDTLLRYQTDATGQFKFFVPKDKLNHKTLGYALRLIDPDYQTYRYKLNNNLFTFQLDDLDPKVPIQILDTVIPVVIVQFNFPTYENPRTALLMGKINEWQFPTTSFTINNIPRSVKYWGPLKFNQPNFISIHGTIDGIPFSDSSHVDLKHRQEYQYNIQP